MGNLAEKMHDRLLTIDILNESGSGPEQLTATIELSELRLIVDDLANLELLRSHARELERAETEYKRAHAEASATGRRVLLP